VPYIWSILVAVLNAMAPDTAPPSARPTLEVSMRWETRTLRPEWAPVVRKHCSDLWQRLGVGIVWREGTATEKGSSAGVTVVVNDIVKPPPSSGVQTSLGWMDFRGETPAASMYVSATTALTLAATIRLGDRPLVEAPNVLIELVAARLVARAAAHEIGHYLLQSRTHARRGLMRETYAPSEGLLPGFERYGLSRRERQALLDWQGTKPSTK
jgi:hypothetical protein